MYRISKRNWKKILFIAFTLINIVFSYLTHYIKAPFWLNENQLLYIFATIAQVTGGLFGLTLAAYALTDDKLKKIGDDEETSVDYTNNIRADSFYNLILISFLSISTIVLSLLVLSIYRIRYVELTIFFILESLFLFFQLLVEIYIFIKNASPDNIVVRKEAEKELFDSEYSALSNGDAKSFGSFITYYNMLENAIKKTAQKEVNDKNNTPLQIMDSLDILKDHKIISQKCYAQINELRLYRNSLVHSPENDKNVSANIYEILVKTYQLLLPITNPSDDESLNNAISRLNTYINSLPSNIDENILNFLISNPDATIRDIAGALNITISEAKRKIHKLITYGYVNKQGTNRRVTFYPAASLPTINGSFSFDYPNNSGIYIIGDNEWKFSTKWSKGSNNIIHAYSDCEDIECIARIKRANLSNISMADLSNCDYSSRCLDIAIGDVAVWKNKNGHFLLTFITAIQDNTRDYDCDLVQGKYRILI